MKKKIDNSVQILNLRISGTQKVQVLRKMRLPRKNLIHIATINPEFVIEARNNQRFAQAMAKCEITVADGWGILWAAKILGLLVPERLTGGELTREILAYSNAHKKKVFLLGGRDGVAEKAALEIAKLYPKVRVAFFEGAKTIKLEKAEEASMTIAKINGFEPDYLLVAYGSPWQDIWIEENRPYLRAKVAMGVGGVLDELAGVVRVCPRWLDELGMKWLFRLLTQPWRWRRQLRLVNFAWLVFAEYVRKIYQKFIN